MGLRSGMDAVFGLHHHFAHAHNAETGTDSLGGLDAEAMAAANGAGLAATDNSAASR